MPDGIICIVKEMFIESNGEKIMTVTFLFLFSIVYILSIALGEGGNLVCRYTMFIFLSIHFVTIHTEVTCKIDLIFKYDYKTNKMQAKVGITPWGL